MSANIFGSKFASFREPAWHKAGIVFTEEITVAEATQLAKIDYDIVKAPAFATVKTVFGETIVPIDGKFFLVRQPTEDDNVYRSFGDCGPDYTHLQASEIATQLDSLSDQWHIETVGALGFGETTFWALDAGKSSVKGEEIKNFFLVTDTINGNTSLRFAFTPVRVVCQNTLISGLRQATVSGGLSHTKGFAFDFQWRMAMLSKLQAAQDSTLATFNHMAEAILSAPQIDEVLAAAYPQPRKPAKADIATTDLPAGFEEVAERLDSIREQWEYYCKLALVRRADTKERLEKYNAENPALANTAWYTWQALVENEDYRTGPEGMFVSAIWGDRAKTKARAFAAALTIAG